MVEPVRTTLSMRQLALDLCNREANQNKLVIMFVATKAGCERMMNELLGYVNDTCGGRGVLGEERESCLQVARVVLR